MINLMKKNAKSNGNKGRRNVKTYNVFHEDPGKNDLHDLVTPMCVFEIL